MSAQVVGDMEDFNASAVEGDIVTISGIVDSSGSLRRWVVRRDVNGNLSLVWENT